jgi:hypothetical protein
MGSVHNFMEPVMFQKIKLKALTEFGSDLLQQSYIENSSCCYCEGTIKEKSHAKYALCGKRTISQAQHKETITEIFGGTNYTFDSNDCILMFKFRSVYGPDVFGTC